ncbi:MAG TPA: DEAD/DEAH box helicase [Candidatus Diapherotrites archaeon]|nr:DEAD/DEAH box helicase [Candidatus Diapherotrites archaeon]
MKKYLYEMTEKELQVYETLFNNVTNDIQFEKISPIVVYGVKVEYKGKPTSKFWTYWKQNKDKLKSIGFIVSKVNGDFVVFLKSLNFKQNLGVEEIIDHFEETPDDSEVVKRLASDLFDWQVPYAQKALKILSSNKAILDASMTGSGKTFICLAVIKELNVPFIVICPKTVIPQWEKVVYDHFKLKPLLITNYEQIKIGKTQYYKPLPEGHKNKSGSNMFWDVPENTVIIFDEAHKTKNYQTANAKLLQDAVEQKISVYLLSATIAENPLKMKTIGQALNLFDDYWKWAFDHGVRKGRFGMEWMGTTQDMEKIHKDIFQKNKGIRIGKDVLQKNLPPLRNEVKFINFSKKNEINKIYKSLQDEIQEIINNKDLTNNEKSSNILAVRMRKRQEIELLKVIDLVELSEDYMEEGNAVAIFVNFKDTIKLLSSKLKTDCIIAGGYNNKQAQDDFNNGKSNIVLVSIKAGGAGISLHDEVGDRPRIALINPTDSAQDLIQCMGRVWRAGGKSMAQAFFLFAKGTVEEEIGDNVKRKVNNINAINDGDLREPFLNEVKFL